MLCTALNALHCTRCTHCTHCTHCTALHCTVHWLQMLSGGYFGVISPEGAASILGRCVNE